jgi:hypothetical protein
VTRRSFVLAGGMALVSARAVNALPLAIASELRRMVGFRIAAADDVRQVFRLQGRRIFQLRASGLFRARVGGGGTLDPATFSEAILFAKPHAPQLRQQFPGLPERAYFDYRLLIDGEFYDVEAFD